ncbi:MAG: tripartite tricarboxylate transporter substrate-binding protein [Pseudomonadota bacterium]
MHANPIRRRDLLQRCAAALLACDAGLCASAQPAVEQLHILCTGPAGSVPDIVARRVADQLAGHAQRTVVDNRPGAAGQIAVSALKSSRPDGGTLLLAQGAIATVYPFLYAKLPYDAALDLKPVSMAGEMTLALAVGPAVPEAVGDVAQLVAWMRRNPGRANVGSPGTGTLPHLLEAMLFRAVAVDWQHVVYAGGPPALVDLMGGQIAALVLPEGLLRQHRAAGKLRVLATSGAARSAYLPDVPSLAEQGFRDLVVREWFAFFMPGSTADAVVAQASRALGAALAQPALAASFAESGMVAVSSTPAALAARIAAEQRYWDPVIRASSIRVE